MDLGECAVRFRLLIRDRDSVFDHVLAGNGMRIIKTPVRSPRANSFAERYVGTLRRECLDRLLIHREQHLRQILTQYTQHLQRTPAAPVARTKTPAVRDRPAG